MELQSIGYDQKKEISLEIDPEKQKLVEEYSMRVKEAEERLEEEKRRIHYEIFGW